MDKNNIYIDTKGNEWCIGTYETNEKKPISSSNQNIIYLPLQILAMYPLNETNNIYCSCVHCHKSINIGIICLNFNKDGFGVRICCFKCSNVQVSIFINKLIINIFDLIEPYITKGLTTNLNKCLVCDKYNCKSMDCIKSEGIIYSNYLEKVFEHFYQIQLDIYSPLLEEYVCAYCQKDKNKRRCGVCKIYQFCSKKCQKKCSDHICNPVYAIWRF